MISLGLLAITAGINYYGGFGAITRHTTLVHRVGGLLVVLGLGLHIWSFVTLRNWWEQNQLCTDGPFRYFRHPMYAAWITFIATGFVLLMNAWSYLVWMVLLHPIWHALVRKEEKTMCRPLVKPIEAMPRERDDSFHGCAVDDDLCQRIERSKQ